MRAAGQADFPYLLLFLTFIHVSWITPALWERSLSSYCVLLYCEIQATHRRAHDE